MGAARVELPDVGLEVVEVGGEKGVNGQNALLGAVDQGDRHQEEPQSASAGRRLEGFQLFQARAGLVDVLPDIVAANKGVVDTSGQELNEIAGELIGGLCIGSDELSILYPKVGKAELEI